MSKKLNKKYEAVCNEYVDIFCKKQGLKNEGWVDDLVGGTAICSDFYFALQDMVWDVNSGQPKGRIIDWYNDNIEDHENSINYYSYTRGLRVSDVKKQRQ